MKGSIHCAGCGRWVGVPNADAAKTIEGIVWCDNCFRTGKAQRYIPRPRGQVRCSHDNGWLSVEKHDIFLNYIGELRIEQKLHGGRIPMRCNNPQCGLIRNIQIPIFRLKRGWFQRDYAKKS